MFEDENDLLFDVPVDDEYQAGDIKCIVRINIGEEPPATMLKSEVLADEETSLSTESEIILSITFSPQIRVETVNLVQTSRNLTFNPEVQTPLIPLGRSVGPNPQKHARNSVQQEPTCMAKDEQKTSQVLKPKKSPKRTRYRKTFAKSKTAF